jgi:lysophospholipase L1-like esterase
MIAIHRFFSRLLLPFGACGMLIVSAQEASPDALAKTKALLPAGTRVVFLGDSITQAGDYVIDVQCALFAQGISHHIINVGLGSETATTLTENENLGHVQAYRFPRPAVGARLSRVLRATRPHTLFVCYGMNDGGVLSNDEAGLARYTQSIEQLRQQALQSGVSRIVFCTPPVHDAQGNAALAAHDANLTRYTEWLLSKRSEGWDVIDFHTPMRRVLDEGRKADLAFALAKDGTHPDRLGHWIMAQQILRDFFGLPHISATEAEGLFPSHGKEIRSLVRQLTDRRFQYWMSLTRHERPGVAGGPDQRIIVDRAEFEIAQAADLRRIHAHWQRAKAADAMKSTQKKSR